RLRALLVEKGIRTAEIEASLHGDEFDASFMVPLPTPEPANIVDTQSKAALSVNIQQPVEMPDLDSTDQLVSAASPPAVPINIGFESASQAGKNGKCIGSPSDIELLAPAEQEKNDLDTLQTATAQR
ncbi:MAG: hypothetical protein Q9180_006546, partial [Flavoplaca navasiana]